MEQPLKNRRPAQKYHHKIMGKNGQDLGGLV
jgi:hypothetical protein